MMKKRVTWRVVRTAAAAVFLSAAVASFTGLAGMGAVLLHVQFGPALLKLIAAFSAGTLATVLGIALVTFLFGRFYCAAFCPLGILQDVIGFLSRRKSVETRNLMWLRYSVAGVVFGMLACGWTAGFFLLDPYSNFGRIRIVFSRLRFAARGDRDSGGVEETDLLHGHLSGRNAAGVDCKTRCVSASDHGEVCPVREMCRRVSVRLYRPEGRNDRQRTLYPLYELSVLVSASRDSSGPSGARERAG